MERGTLALIGSDASDRAFFRRAFNPYELRLGLFANAKEASAAFPLAAQVITILNLPPNGAEQREQIAALRAVDPQLILLLIPRAAQVVGAAELASLGAYGALARPLEAGAWRLLVGAALRVARQTRDRVSFEPYLDQEDWQEAIVGGCEAMRGVISALPTLANSDAPVLISGEEDTGKSLVARALHQHSRRSSKTFVAVGQAQTPPTGGEGQDAGATKLWPLELGPTHCAHQGTLYLEEVCALSQHAQADLLRMISGGSVDLDARVIVGTSQAIEEQLISRRFNQELYDRLAPNLIQMPPLRERPGDLRLLIDYFLTNHAEAFGASGKTFAPEVITALERYHWPGNVRELERLVRRALLTARGETVLLGDLPPHMLDCVGVPETRVSVPLGGRTMPDRWMAHGRGDMIELSRTLFDWSRKDRRFRIIPAMERELILHALAETQGNQLRAAKLLGISRATLRKRFQKLDIKQEMVIR